MSHENTPVSPAVPAWSRLRELVAEVSASHRNPDSVDYNRCEDRECAWCQRTREAIEQMEVVSPAVEGPSEPLRERLAALAHAQWSGWMDYLFSRCSMVNGKMRISRSDYNRWLAQSHMAYNELTEAEKESDRAEADRVLALIPAISAGGTPTAQEMWNRTQRPIGEQLNRLAESYWLRGKPYTCGQFQELAREVASIVTQQLTEAALTAERSRLREQIEAQLDDIERGRNHITPHWDELYCEGWKAARILHEQGLRAVLDLLTGKA